MVLPVPTDASSLAGSVAERAFTGHESMVRTVAAIMVHDLRLPLPDQVTVYVYASRHVFERGLVEDAQISPGRAAELSEFAIGIGRPRQILLSDDGVRGREWFRLIAHELTHVSQIELAGGEGRAEQWLAEGMAEWVAFSVLERLAFDTVAGRRAASIAGIRNHAALVAARLDLESLGSPRGFTLRHQREGSVPTYQLAFLMADYLIARHGFARLVDYFASFGTRRDRVDNFRRAFGQTLDEFEREILSHLTGLVR